MTNSCLVESNQFLKAFKGYFTWVIGWVPLQNVFVNLDSICISLVKYFIKWQSVNWLHNVFYQKLAIVVNLAILIQNWPFNHMFTRCFKKSRHRELLKANFLHINLLKSHFLGMIYVQHFQNLVKVWWFNKELKVFTNNFLFWSSKMCFIYNGSF